jgi:hypothetical protein
MNLFLNYIANRVEDTRSMKDRRFKVIKVIASYTGEDNQEYRKSFEAKTEPIVPEIGTHEQLNKLKIQYK